MSLAQRTVTSIGWNAASSVMRVGVGFVQSIILARLLTVETFGVFRSASVIIILSVVFFQLGLGGALIHRGEHSEDEEQAAAVHFTLSFVFVMIWYALIVIYALVALEGKARAVLLVLATTHVLMSSTSTGKLILMRRVVHRRLALLGTVIPIVASIIAVTLAWQGFGVWALISTQVTAMVLAILGLYVYRPVWRPQLSLHRPTVRYFLSFGLKNMWSAVFQRYLDSLDDLWTSIFLGDYAMGLYSRAYTFASYPRQVLAAPVNTVAIGTYAELKQARKQLSQSFFQINALLVRTGFALAGILALVAPEFIRILIGAKWLPFLDTFRLMLIFTLLDPLKVTIGNLFVAVGRPEIAAQTRGVQLIILVVGLVILAPLYGIIGVAIAVNIMLIIGIGIMLWRAKEFVDLSIVRLFGVPAFALVLGLICGHLSIQIPHVLGTDLRTLLVKTTLFFAVYSFVLFSIERKQTVMVFNRIRKTLGK